MKRLLVFLLAFALLFTLAACGGDGDTSEDKSQVSKEPGTSNDESSAPDDESEVSTPDDQSDDVSEDPSTELPAFINKYVSFGEAVNVQIRATDSTSIRLTKINEVADEGDIVLFTTEFGASISTGTETYEDFAILVCEYDHEVFGYKKVSLKPVGEDEEKSETEIPEDGFIIAVSTKQATEIGRLNNIQDEHKFFVHGMQILDMSIDLKKLSTAPTIDGNISSSEYGQPIWVVNENNLFWDYSQFEKDQYYATAEVYAAYDDDYLYLGVIVDSPYHYNPLSQGNASSMWQYECIQVNVSSVDPQGEYMSENFDYEANNKKAMSDGIVRQYGFGANDDNETLSTVWMGIETEFTGEAFCRRDDVNEKTFYEVAIPWSELGSEDYPFDIDEAEKIGFSISINCGDDDAWKNVKMRDGGGIIGRNDFSKMASATLK